MTNVIKQLTDYLRGSVEEIRKITWPTKQQTINYSVVVFGMSVGVALFFGIVDYILNLGLEQLIR